MRWISFAALIGACSLVRSPSDFTVSDVAMDAATRDTSLADADVGEDVADTGGPECDIDESCGLLTRATARCDDGRCVIVACDEGAFDCNGLSGDGCESDVACANPSVDVGRGHACAIDDAGEVHCWGRNRSGQIDLELRPRPTGVVPFQGGVRALGVAAGRAHTCIIDVEGHLLCAGANQLNQLGHAEGEVLGRVESTDPEFESRTFRTLDSRENHTCAIDNDGDVWCWGGPTDATGADSGETGAFRTAHEGNRFVQVAVSTASTCALTDSGNVVCWGRNDAGQLGRGTTGDAQTRGPVTDTRAEAPLANVEEIFAGFRAFCALVDDTGLVCWGRTPGAMDTSAPEAQPRLVATVAEEAWMHNATWCWRTGPGTVICRGDNQEGERGDGIAEPADSSNAQSAVDLENMHAVSADAFNGCGYRGEELHCWGAAYDGITLRESLIQTPAPIVDSGGNRLPLQGVSLALRGGCGVAPDAEPVCWGDGAEGVLGRGTRFPSAVPVEVSLLPSAAVIARGPATSCAVEETGSRGELWCWGSDRNGLTTGLPESSNAVRISVPDDRDVFTVAVGIRHGCALGADDSSVSLGRAYCWGQSDFGQIDGTPRSDTQGMTLVGGVFTLRDIVVGARHTCASRETGVFCWGNNDYGQIGPGLGTLPRRTIEGGTAVHALAAGAQHNCAILKFNREVHCWGDNSSGQVTGTPTPLAQAAPVRVGDFQNVRSVSAGARHSCAALDDGTVVCWGANDVAQHGAGNFESATGFREVPGLTGALVLSSPSEGHATCAERATDVMCWGLNDYNALGTDPSLYSVPVPIPLGE